MARGADVLAQAFFDDPLNVYTEPNPGPRMEKFAWLFAGRLREAATPNGVYTCSTDGEPVGVAVWIPPCSGELPAHDDGDGHELVGLHFGRDAYV